MEEFILFLLSLGIPVSKALSSDNDKEREKEYDNILESVAETRIKEAVMYLKKFGGHLEPDSRFGWYIPRWIPPDEEEKKKEVKEKTKSPPPDPDDDPTPPDDGGGGGLPEPEMKQTIKLVPEEVIPTSKAEIKTTYLTEEEIIKQIGGFEIIVSELTTNSDEIKRVDETADYVIVHIPTRHRVHQGKFEVVRIIYEYQDFCVPQDKQNDDIINIRQLK